VIDKYVYDTKYWNKVKCYIYIFIWIYPLASNSDKPIISPQGT
jgi:hypothetical protein